MDYDGGEQSFFELPDNFALEDQKIFEARPVLSREREPIVASSLGKGVDYGTYVLQNVYAHLSRGSILRTCGRNT